MSRHEQDVAKLRKENEQSALLEQRLQSGGLQPKEIVNDLAQWMWLRSAPLRDLTPVQFAVSRVEAYLEFETRKRSADARESETGAAGDLDTVSQIEAPIDYAGGLISESPRSQIEVEVVAMRVFKALERALLEDGVGNLRGYLYRGGWRAAYQAFEKAKRRVLTPDKLARWHRQQALTRAKRTHDEDLEAMLEISLELQLRDRVNPDKVLLLETRSRVERECIEFVCEHLDPSLRPVYRAHYLEGRAASDIVRMYTALAASEPGNRSRGRAVTPGTIRNYLTRARQQAQPALQQMLSDLRSKLLDA